MSEVVMAIGSVPVYSCNGNLYKAIEASHELEHHIGKVWPVINVQKIIDMLKSKPKWLLLKRKPNIPFDYLEAHTPEIIAFTHNKTLIILTLTPIIITNYYVDSAQDLVLPEPMQVCVPNLPLKSYNMEHLPDFDSAIFDVIRRNASLDNIGYKVNVVDVTNRPSDTNVSTQVPIYPQSPTNRQTTIIPQVPINSNTSRYSRANNYPGRLIYTQ